METLEATLDGDGSGKGRPKFGGLRGYLVIITIDLPYPKSFEFRQQASSIAPAVSRSLKELRKQVGRKKIKEFRIKAVQL